MNNVWRQDNDSNFQHRHRSIWVDLVYQKEAAEGTSEVDDTDGNLLPDYYYEEDNS